MTTPAKGKSGTPFRAERLSNESTRKLSAESAGPRRPSAVIGTSLPAELTSFVGREDDLQILPERLARTRLLTLVGAGGIGKTRLALKLVGQVATDYADGVMLAEPAPLSQPDLVVQAVARALGLQPFSRRRWSASQTPSGVRP